MITMKSIYFSYDNCPDANGLKDVSLHVGQGEVVLLCGESGCGKTTLTRLINGLIPHYYGGNLSGELNINGIDPRQVGLYDIACHVGSIFQNPRSQFYCMDTTSELAFGCENQGYQASEIVRRVALSVDHLHIEHLMNRNLFQLSGGEKQKIACGSVHAVSPPIIVLDEPSSNLDSQSTELLGQIINHWKQEGKTILIAEHRLYYLRDIADRMIYMHEGRIIKDVSMEKALGLSSRELATLGLRVFSLDLLSLPSSSQVDIGPETIKLTDFTYSYKKGKTVMEIDSLALPRGGVTAVVGSNGSGKTTFAKGCCALHRRFKGKITVVNTYTCADHRCKRAYMVMQDVNHQLFAQSVIDEVLLSMEVPDETEALRILESLDLHALKDIHPMALSGGEKQRVAVAAAIASQRELLVFDEPTSGLDLRRMLQVSENIKKMKDMGKTVILITHDLELIVRTCNYIVHLSKGSVVESFSLNERTMVDLMHIFSQEAKVGSVEV